jgi:hypothetical protein
MNRQAIPMPLMVALAVLSALIITHPLIMIPLAVIIPITVAMTLRAARRRTYREVRRAKNREVVYVSEMPGGTDVRLDTSNPTSVIRRRLESGALYVPLGTCQCDAHPRPHQHAGTTPVRSAPAQLTAAPPQPDCRDGGPCRAGHRRAVHDARGNRVASLCTHCNRQEYWQPFLAYGTSR